MVRFQCPKCLMLTVEVVPHGMHCDCCGNDWIELGDWLYKIEERLYEHKTN